MTTLYNYLNKNQDNILDDIETLVSAESPSHDKIAVDACGQKLREIFRNRLDCEAEIFPETKQGDHLGFTLGNGKRQLLILGHIDTVWEKGRLRIRRDKEKFYGPGILDMKAGIIQSIWAVKALQELEKMPDWCIRFLCTSDEELGSPTSRQYIEREAMNSDAAFIVEPATAVGSALKTQRKGSGRFYVEISGKAAHSGNNPEDGVSAIEEMAFQIQHLHGLADAAKGTTINVGMAKGGGALNVVADHAELGIDVRVTSQEEANRVKEAIYRLTPRLEGARLSVSGAMTRPPMERTESTSRLYEQARSIAETLDFELAEASVGGGSDGNFTAAMGVPTLDGLGATGAAPHAEYEHIEIDTIVPRTALLAELIQRL